MKKPLLLGCLIFMVLTLAQAAKAQNTNSTKTEIPAANPADVASTEVIVKALYEVISGGIGQKRDWDRFRSLFYKDARLVATYKNQKTGKIAVFSATPDRYVELSAPQMEKEGFFEKELAHQVEMFGNVAHVFSTYESFYKPDDKKPFERGINSFQLVSDGTRWWILTISWQDETPELPIPKMYLKSNK